MRNNSRSLHIFKFQFLTCKLLLSGIFLWCCIASGAQIIVVPGHALSRDTPLDKIVCTRITNKGTIPATFLFTIPVKGNEQRFSTNTGHTEWLLSHVANRTDSLTIQMTLIQAELSFIKSPYFVNRMFPMSPYNSDEPDSMFVRMFAQGTSTAWFFGQCGEFWRMFYTHLIATGYFTAEKFRDVNLQNHITGEVRVGNGWIWIDADPSMPASSPVSDPTAPNHFASAATIKKNLSWLRPYKWVSPQGDSVRLTDVLVEDYYMYFELSYSPVFAAPVHTENGLVILPQGATITWSDTIGHIIDKSDAGTIDTLNQINTLLRTPHIGPKQIDSADNLMQGLTGMTFEKISNYHDDPTVSLFFINSKLYENMRALLPTIKLNAGPGKHVIGRDVKFPGFITNVEGTATFADTSLSGPVNLWNYSKQGSPFVAYKSLHVLNGGKDLSENSIITLTYNPMLGMNFYQDVYIDQLEKPDTLLIEKWDNGSLIYSSCK